MAVLLRTGVATYHSAVRLAALWRPKAKAWVEGRRDLWPRLREKAPALEGCLWMHCASVGEFEQGRPVLEAIKQRHPDLPVLLTFFSPSGYEARKHEPLATHVDYLPADGAENARHLLHLVKPRLAVFVKYEFWYHHLKALQQAAVPTYLISALFRPGQPFFRWYGSGWRAMLHCFTHISTQDAASMDLLRSIGIRSVSVGGDTRYDRVAAIARQGGTSALATAFHGTGPTLVCGSTWPGDDDRLATCLGERRWKCLVAPHELSGVQLQRIAEAYPKPLALWSELEAATPANMADTLGAEERATLVVDRMGLLSRLYAAGDVAYVGGGFGDGIHNLLEAAVWGKPVLFGPRHRKFPEAQGLIAAGAGHEVRDEATLGQALDRLFQDPNARAEAGRAAARYVQERTGATERIMQLLGPALG